MNYTTKFWKRFVSLILAVIFCVSNNSYAVSVSSGSSDFKVPNISIPPEIGSIQELYKGNRDKSICGMRMDIRRHSGIIFK